MSKTKRKKQEQIIACDNFAGSAWFRQTGAFGCSTSGVADYTKNKSTATSYAWASSME